MRGEISKEDLFNWKGKTSVILTNVDKGEEEQNVGGSVNWQSHLGK